MAQPAVHEAVTPEEESADYRDLLDFGPGELTAVERWQIRFVRKTFESGRLDRVIRILQRQIGANWIDVSTRNLLHVHGVDRLPAFARGESTILVSNHRSFFDLFVVSSVLLKRPFGQRIMFPVRSQFFYDTPLGLAVNGAMSFFAMYPPVFRQRERATLNLASLDEVTWLLKRGGTFCGIHPEGTRKKDDDPYTFLPAQSGVGRIIRHANVPVLPVFVNGLGNDFVKQVASDFSREGTPITVVFGRPIDFRTLLDEPPSPRLYKRISERTLEVIGELAEEERGIRKTLID